jgi:hypothetical protein
MAGQTTVRELLIAVIMFTALISGIFTLIAYSTPTQTFAGDEQYNTTFNKFNSVRDNANAMSNTIRNPENKQNSILGVLDDLLKLAVGVTSQIWTSIDILTTILQDLSDTFGIPLWATQSLTAILLIGVIFALMAAWFRWLI